MNDLEQLRATLERHADDVVDHDPLGRVGSVHSRVRGVRRRRRAAAAGTAALTLAVVGGVALLPERDAGPAPATPTVLGMTVPSSFDSLGYTYDFDRSVEGDTRASVRLAASDEPQLVSWGTVGDDDTVEVTRYGTTTTYTAADFSDFVLVPAGDATTVRVVGSSEVGLAVFALTSDRPEGVTSDGITYRQEVAGQQLIAAGFGEPGEAEVELEAAAVSRGVRFSVECAGAPAGSSVHLDLAGEEGGFITGQCDEEVLPFDPGATGSVGIPTRPGEDVSVRAWVSEGTEDGPLLEDDDVVISVAVYDDAPSGTRLAGSDVSLLVESGGHLWRLTSMDMPAPGGGRVSVAGQRGRQLLAIGFTAAGDATVVLEHSGTGETVRADGGDVSGGEIGVLDGVQDRATVRVLGPVPPGAEVAIALYVRAD
ncbi:hypothetical protein [Nocardioides psychrotolerans]|uniref:hypothetical protein n=1 Tax=Nocardioides psychrotolerans TaxID=1005945 RepID=UPI003137D722